MSDLPTWFRPEPAEVSLKEFKAAIAEERRLERKVVTDIARAVRTSDTELFGESPMLLDNRHCGTWCRAFRAAARAPSPSEEFRVWFLGIWIGHGDHVRQEVGHDAVLFHALRNLLPKYEGPGLKLYRGDAAGSRRGRTYGPSWSSDVETARAFALGFGAMPRAEVSCLRPGRRRMQSSAPRRSSQVPIVNRSTWSTVGGCSKLA